MPNVASAEKRMTDAPDVHDAVRSLTEDEVSFFWKNGWAPLPKLIDPEIAGRLVEEDGFPKLPDRPSHAKNLYRAVAHSLALGRSAARLLGRDSAIRLFTDVLEVDPPHRSGSEPTTFRQDSATLPFDRAAVTFRIALGNAVPQAASTRFFSQSQELGPLGRDLELPEDELVAKWPRLGDLPRSEPITRQPGDATAHHWHTVHGRLPNSTSDARWTYALVVFPADARYTIPHPATRDLEFEQFRELDHPDFPIVYTLDEI